MSLKSTTYQRKFVTSFARCSLLNQLTGQGFNAQSFCKFLHDNRKSPFRLCTTGGRHVVHNFVLQFLLFERRNCPKERKKKLDNELNKSAYIMAYHE